ncbi:MAG: hypothetical protein JO291_13990, partial [Acidimicrobiia bacterium]|nr:hypothetical protein [Acidimicrobiia bacterium]
MLACLGSTLGVLLPAGSPAGAATYVTKTERVDVATDGTPPGSSNPFDPSISSDGRFVAFDSEAAFDSADTNGPTTEDVYVRDLLSGTTSLMSVGGSGAPGGNASTGGGAHHTISADGRYVAFTTVNVLTPGDANNAQDVFVRDRDVDGDGIYDEPDASSTVLVSRPSVLGQVSSVASANAFSYQPVLSSSGRFVAFRSNATDLVPGGSTSPTRGDVFVADRDADHNGVFDEPGGTSMRRVSVAPDGSDVAGDGVVAPTAISDDGRFVLMTSQVPLAPPGGSSNGVYLRDRDTDDDGVLDEPGASTTVEVDAAPGGAAPNAGVNLDLAGSDMTPDGRYVTFVTQATNLTPTHQPSGETGVYQWDRQTGTTKLLLGAGDPQQIAVAAD